MTSIQQKSCPSPFLPASPHLHSLIVGTDTGSHLMREVSTYMILVGYFLPDEPLEEQWKEE